MNRNKKNIVYVGIVLILVIIIAGGFWVWKGNQKVEIGGERNEEQVENLVWYEIPESGIRFKVTPDTKEDLKYDFNSYDMKFPVIKILATGLYSETERKDKRCVLSEEGFSCGNFRIVSTSKENTNTYEKESNQKWCDEQNSIIFKEVNKDNFYCVYITSEMKDYVIDDSEYKKIFHLLDDSITKKFGIYLNTIESIQ